jgi:hypothetical protein
LDERPHSGQSDAIPAKSAAHPPDGELPLRTIRHINVRRVLLVFLLTAAALVAPSLPHAKACSCAASNGREGLASADAAFVGRLLSRDDPQPVGDTFSSATIVRYRYVVERAVKGAIPARAVEVWSAWSGVSCGLETPVGQRAGLLLRRQDGRWLSSLCEQVDPDVLVPAGQSLPSLPATEPTSSGHVVTLPAPDEGGAGGRPLLAGGAAAGFLAAGLAGLLRRRGLAKLPPL